MAERDVKIRIISQDQASAQLKQVGASVGQMAAAFVAAQASIAGVTAVMDRLVGTFRHAIELASIQEESERKLAQAFEQAGVKSRFAVEAAQDYASQLQEQSRYGDEAIMVAQRYLVTLGGLTGEGLNRATRATIDLAEAIDIDLKSAAMLMAKAAAGSTEALSRYGIILDENIPKEKKFDELLKQIEEKMGGSAAAAAETYAGVVDQLSNAWGDFLETLGNTVTQAEPVRNALQRLTDTITGLNAGLKNLSPDEYRYFTTELRNATFAAIDAGKITREQQAAIIRIAEKMVESGQSWVYVLGEIRDELSRPGGMMDWIAKMAGAYGVDISMWFSGISAGAKKVAQDLPDATQAMKEWEEVFFRRSYGAEPSLLGVAADQMDELADHLDMVQEIRNLQTETLDNLWPSPQRMKDRFDLSFLKDSLKDVDRQLDTLKPDAVESFTTIAEIGREAAEIIGNAFAAQFARLVVEGGKLKDLLKNLLKLAIEIAIELGIRAAIHAAFPGLNVGGQVARHAAAGLVVGPDLSVDRVPVLLSPGEVVLSRPEAERYRSGSGSGEGTPVSVSVTVMDRRRMAEALLRDINDLVRRRGGTLVASEVT